MEYHDLVDGRTVMLDIEDRELFESREWWLSKDGYVVCGSGRLHRLILSAQPGVEVDHRNGNPLDNRRHNLRLATRAQNMRSKEGCSSTGYKGVYLEKGAYRAQITVDGKRITLGMFDCPVQAAHTYDLAAVAAWGEWARPNFHIPDAG